MDFATDCSLAGGAFRLFLPETSGNWLWQESTKNHAQASSAFISGYFSEACCFRMVQRYPQLANAVAHLAAERLLEVQMPIRDEVRQVNRELLYSIGMASHAGCSTGGQAIELRAVDQAVPDICLPASREH